MFVSFSGKRRLVSFAVGVGGWFFGRLGCLVCVCILIGCVSFKHATLWVGVFDFFGFGGCGFFLVDWCCWRFWWWVVPTLYRDTI